MKFKFLLLMMLNVIIKSTFDYKNSNFMVENPIARINEKVKLIWNNTNNNDKNLKIVVCDKYNETIHIHDTSSNPGKNGSILISTPSEPGKFIIKFCVNKNNYCPLSTELILVDCPKEKRTMSNIKHIIIIISENHSFDSIYGNYCTAPTFSKPKCNTGRECCEKAPNIIDGEKPKILTNKENFDFSPCHSFDCEFENTNGRKMDKFVKGGQYSDPSNFAVGINSTDSVSYYMQWAEENAISDNFFQSTLGASCSNDMFFATAKFIFKDNEVVPQNKEIRGIKCYDTGFKSYYDPTIADLLNTCNITWTFYGEGYDINPNNTQCYPDYYDASDDPFTYFPSLTQSPTSDFNFRDLNSIYEDIDLGKLPSINYIKGLGKHSEHPGYEDSLKTGQLLSKSIIEKIKHSNYSNDTLIVLVPDESGGYYDHIPPPHKSIIDGSDYGPRTQFVVIGDIAKKNYVSHVQLEPSSLIKFIEWNWFDAVTGQLQARDSIVNNIGDLLDPIKAGINIPKKLNLLI